MPYRYTKQNETQDLLARITRSQAGKQSPAAAHAPDASKLTKQRSPKRKQRNVNDQASAGLCCTNRVRDSSRESSMVAVMHEQPYPPTLQDQELASL